MRSRKDKRIMACFTKIEKKVLVLFCNQLSSPKSILTSTESKGNLGMIAYSARVRSTRIVAVVRMKFTAMVRKWEACT